MNRISADITSLALVASTFIVPVVYWYFLYRRIEGFDPEESYNDDSDD